MSLFAPPLISLLFFSGFAVGDIYAPGCSVASWEWSLNSLGQDPCTVAAYMMSTCHGGTYTVPALQPGYHYIGPSGGAQAGDLCVCNTITYSLMSACDGCQGSDWISWPDYSNNCTTTLPPGTFINPIPPGTYLPRWALIDVTNENNWDANLSMAVGDKPEQGPGTNLNPSAASSAGSTSFVFPTTSSTSTSTGSNSRGASSNSATPIPSNGHSSNTGAIVGGVVGGIGGISILAAALLFYRRRRQQAPSAPSASDGQPGGFNPLTDQVPHSMSGQGTVTSSLPDTSNSVLRQSNPDELAAYPAYQGMSPPPTYNPVISPSPTSSRNLYTVAAAPNPPGQGLGYDFHPVA